MIVSRRTIKRSGSCPTLSVLFRILIKRVYIYLYSNARMQRRTSSREGEKLPRPGRGGMAHEGEIRPWRGPYVCRRAREPGWGRTTIYAVCASSSLHQPASSGPVLCPFATLSTLVTLLTGPHDWLRRLTCPDHSYRDGRVYQGGESRCN